MLRRALAAPRFASIVQQSLSRWSYPFAGAVRDLSNGKDAKSRAKIPVELREEDLEEQFVKGWGKGGQKINKVRNCVLLKHVPTGLHIRCQETRSLDGNRRIARRLLLQKLDDQINGELSKNNLKIEKLRKKKANRQNKSKQKYAARLAQGSDSNNENDDEESDGSDDNVSDFEEEDDEVDEVEAEDDASMDDIDIEQHKVRSKR